MKIMENTDNIEIGVFNPARAKKVEAKTKKFMKSVKEFLTVKGGGSIPSEWQLSLELLEMYYRQFMNISLQLEDEQSYVISSRYGVMPHPLLKIQNNAAIRLEKQMSELGLSLKSGKKLEVTDVKKEDSALDKFLKKQVEKR